MELKNVELLIEKDLELKENSYLINESFKNAQELFSYLHKMDKEIGDSFYIPYSCLQITNKGNKRFHNFMTVLSLFPLCNFYVICDLDWLNSLPIGFIVSTRQRKMVQYYKQKITELNGGKEDTL
jgi:hypothetical protein